jgi:hypothetical protein
MYETFIKSAKMTENKLNGNHVKYYGVMLTDESL